jgi:CRISPR/Cas system-associated exonuclease Cas4 (RecB family)
LSGTQRKRYGNVSNGGGELAGSVVSIPDPSTRKISLSEMVEYRDCRRKWYLHHKLGLSKKDKTGALALGTNVHTSLQTYYTPGGTRESALLDFDTIYENLKNEANEYEIEGVLKDEKLGRTMLEGYFDWAEETGVDAHLEIIEAEAEIEYPMEILGQPILLVGKRDLIGRNALTGVNKLVDHKTCQSFNDNMMDLNEQARMYLLLQRLVGSTEVQEVLWNKLRKVLRTARANPPFYQREELYISEEELRRFFIRIRGIIRDMLMTEAQLADGQDPYEFCYPRPNNDCTWKCQFRKVCPLMDSDPVGATQMLSDMFEVEDPYERYNDVKGV